MTLRGRSCQVQTRREQHAVPVIRASEIAEHASARICEMREGTAVRWTQRRLVMRCGRLQRLAQGLQILAGLAAALWLHLLVRGRS